MKNNKSKTAKLKKEIEIKDHIIQRLLQEITARKITVDPKLLKIINFLYGEKK